MNSKPVIGVFMGGWSGERAISLKTGSAVAKGLENRGYEVRRIDVARAYFRNFVEPDFDIGFIALHGRYGEDGTLQGWFDLMGLPYTGSGMTASAIAMHKAHTKRIVESFGIPTPSYQLLDKSAWESAGKPGLTLTKVSPGHPAYPAMEPPLVVKPNSEGSTIGIHIIKEAADLVPGLEDAFRHDKKEIGRASCRERV